MTNEMKRIAVFAVILCSLMLLTGCMGKLDGSFPDDAPMKAESAYPVASVRPDWLMYGTASEVVNASTNVYSGRVESVSFEIVDMKTGKADPSPSSEATSRMLYTIYTVSVIESFKGENPATVKICRPGGIIGFNEEEQYRLMQESGLLAKFEGIPISIDKCTLAEGEEYLFCTIRNSGDFDHIINPTQFAHRLDSHNAKEIIRQAKAEV